MIIGISGKKQSGKDTIGKIIKYLSYMHYNAPKVQGEELFNEKKYNLYLNSLASDNPTWEVKKFADPLKDMVCLMLGCTREELEKEKFKNTPLGDEWIRYSYATGHTTDNEGNKTMLSTQCTEEKYNQEHAINWQTAYKTELTPRLIQQWIGTEVGRVIHEDVWVNSVMKDYYDQNMEKGQDMVSQGKEYTPNLPDWIMTDVRFPNEYHAIDIRGGLIIRVEKSDLENKDTHESETALDNHVFKYRIFNDGSIEELIQNVYNVLTLEKIWE